MIEANTGDNESINLDPMSDNLFLAAVRHAFEQVLGNALPIDVAVTFLYEAGYRSLE